MQDFHLLREEGVNLYRVCYKSKASNEIHKPNGFHKFEAAQKIAAGFNARYEEDYEYFLEQVNLKSLSEATIVDLVHQDKLSPEEALPHLSLKSSYAAMWKPRDIH